MVAVGETFNLTITDDTGASSRGDIVFIVPPSTPGAPSRLRIDRRGDYEVLEYFSPSVRGVDGVTLRRRR